LSPSTSKHSNSGSFIRPESFPFFYGFVVLIVGTIGVWFSIPGQTIGVSVFTDPVKDALGLSRNQFSNAYMVGTIMSSLIIGRAGRWFDSYGARWVALGAALGISLTLLTASFSPSLAQKLAVAINISRVYTGFVVITLLFFLLRFFGQGVLTMASRNMIMMWWDKYRGRANMVTSISLSFGFSSAPIWLSILIDDFGWSGAWQVMALALAVFSIIILQFYRVRPEDHGLLPDGIRKEQESLGASEQPRAKKQFTLEEARKTRAFWVFTLLLAFNSFFITGLTFHVVSIFESTGLSKEDAVRIFLPGSFVSVTVSTVFNYLSDRSKLKIFAYIMMFGGLLACLGMFFLNDSWGRVLLIGGMGSMGGFFGVLNSVTWPRFFGRQHLGAVTGRVMSILIFASAIAPSVFSFSYTLLGSYSYMAYLGVVLIAALAVAGTKANNPQPYET
jgi:OFA family oxalate/formate antiporter-like MFS transporter